MSRLRDEAERMVQLMKSLPAGMQRPDPCCNCVACGEPRSEHIGPPAPPLTRGHLGATEDRPGSCRTTTGVHVHNREKRT